MSVTSEPAVVTPKDASVEEPSNLFVEFLQYTSIALHLKDEKSLEHARMSLLILGTITEVCVQEMRLSCIPSTILVENASFFFLTGSLHDTVHARLQH